jgi:hypothetical protein
MCRCRHGISATGAGCDEIRRARKASGSCIFFRRFASYYRGESED